MSDRAVRMENITRCCAVAVPLQKQIEEDVARFGLPARPEQGATLNTAGPMDLWDKSGLHPTTGTESTPLPVFEEDSDTRDAGGNRGEG